MKLQTIIRTLAAAALVASPSIAMAQSYPNNNGCPNGQWVNGQCVNNNDGRWSDAQRRDRDRQRAEWERSHPGQTWNDSYYNNGAYNNGRYNGNNGYGYGNNGYGNNGYGRGGYGGGELNATVSSFSPYNLYLNNGVHVELHNGTVINPTGTTLRPGMRVRVMGNRNGDGSFNANEIDVVGNGNGYGGYRY